jgi:7-cyano-7-deazaguanine synthase
MVNKVVISMSGGLDSTCLALHMLSQGKEVRAYAFDYGQKHDVELSKLKTNIEYWREKGLPITLQVIDLKDVFSDSQSSLTGNGDIPEGHYEDENMKSTVVENRNIIFSSIIYGKALSWAKQTDSKVRITLGIHAGDHTIYPDCTPESQAMARELFRISNWGSENVDYVTPFVNSTKGEVLEVGVMSMKKMGFSDEDITYVLDHTHTCYSPDDQGRSCGKCGSCTERLEAFEYVEMKDPVKYQE